MLGAGVGVDRGDLGDLFRSHDPFLRQDSVARRAAGETAINDQGETLGTAMCVHKENLAPKAGSDKWGETKREAARDSSPCLALRGKLASLAADHFDEAFFLFEAKKVLDLLGDGGHAEGLGKKGVEAGGLAFLSKLGVEEAADEDVLRVGEERDQFLFKDDAIVAGHVVVDKEDYLVVAGREDAKGRLGIEEAGDVKTKTKPVPEEVIGLDVVLDDDDLSGFFFFWHGRLDLDSLDAGAS